MSDPVILTREQYDKLRAELAAFTEALGLLSTLAPKMEIDVTNPVKMAQEIDAAVRAELAAAREKNNELILELHAALAKEAGDE